MIIRIPQELRQRFIASRQNFIRDMACIPMMSLSPFFKRKIDYSKIISPFHKNPWNDQTHSFDGNFTCESPEFARFLHFDLSQNRDRVGFACCHAPRFVDRLRFPVRSRKNQSRDTKKEPEMMRVPYVKYDFVGRVEVSKRDELDYNMILDIVTVTEEKGFDIWLITFDRFNSATLMQMLKEMGFLVANLSVDRTANFVVIDNDPKIKERTGQPLRRKTTEGNYIAAMQSFKDIIDEGRCEICYDRQEDGLPVKDWLRYEIECAEFDAKKLKVDHIPKGTNDMLQGMAGACYNLHNILRDTPDRDEQESENVDDYAVQQNRVFSNPGDQEIARRNPAGDTWYLEYAETGPSPFEALGL